MDLTSWTSVVESIEKDSGVTNVLMTHEGAQLQNWVLPVIFTNSSAEYLPEKSLFLTYQIKEMLQNWVTEFFAWEKSEMCLSFHTLIMVWKHPLPAGIPISHGATCPPSTTQFSFWLVYQSQVIFMLDASKGPERVSVWTHSQVVPSASCFLYNPFLF